MWTGLIRWRILIDCLGVKMLRYEGDWWEYCGYEKVTEMRLAVTGVLAVRIKCRALFLLGQKGASKQCFDKFAQEHLRLLNTYPEISYDEVVS